MLTKSQIEDFHNNGFLVVKGLLDNKSIPQLLEALDQVKKKVERNPDNFNTRYAQNNSESVDTWGVSDLFHPDLYEPCFGEFIAKSGLLECVRDLLQESELRFWGANALWNPNTVDYFLPWHRDGGDQKAHDPTGRSTHVQFNVALIEDHSFMAIPGSHKRLLSEREMDVVNNLSTESLPGETLVECEAGDVLFMNAWTLHRGSCNSNQFRRTFHINLQPKEEPYGGGTSQPWMKESSYLSRLSSELRFLVENLVEWDEANPLPRKSRTAIKHIHLLSQPMDTFEKNALLKK
jgi:ectoine hydroxylase-related dioxygenase (phytanoyl-CoA dioxygenase family)